MAELTRTLRTNRKRGLLTILSAVLVVALVLVFAHVSAERVLAITPTLTPAATATPTPTPADAGNFTFTNNTGQPAAHFVLIALTITVGASVVTQPAECGTPETFGGFEYVEFIWPTACIGPGESIVLDTFRPHSYSFAPSPPVVSAVNNKGLTANELLIDIGPTGGIAGALLIQNAPGCPEPTFEVQPSLELRIVWNSACVDPGEKVAVHVAGGGAGGFNITNLASQFAVTPIGGIGVFPDVSGFPLETPASSGPSTGWLAGIAGAGAAVAALGGAAWYARRRAR